MKRFIFIFIVLFCGVHESLRASVVVVVDTKEGFSVAKNFDSKSMIGYLVVNPRGVEYSMMSAQYPYYSYVSKYGSVTFNQLSKNLPIGGVNEKGLIVEMIEAQEMSEREEGYSMELNEYETVKILLDKCKSVKEAVEMLRYIKINVLVSKVHYFLVDQSGESAIVEFLGGEVSIYDVSYANYYSMLNRGVYSKSIDSISENNDRLSDDDKQFSAIYSELNKENVNDISEIFNFLDRFKKPDNCWSIIYQKDKLYFKTIASPVVKYVDISEINFNIDKHLYLDINRLFEAKCNDQFIELDESAHRSLVKNSFLTINVAGFDDEAQEAIIVNDVEKLQNTTARRKDVYKTLKVTVSNLDSDKGVLRVFLYNSAKGFDESVSWREAAVQVNDEAGEAYFYNIPADGQYAIYYFHDENMNNIADRQWVGLPQEDTGYSRNAGRDFEDARIEYSDAENGHYRIKNRSFLFW